MILTPSPIPDFHACKSGVKSVLLGPWRLHDLTSAPLHNFRSVIEFVTLRILSLQFHARESGVESVIGPLEDMYALLARYEVKLPKEECDAVSDLRYSWKKVRTVTCVGSVHRLGIGKQGHGVHFGTLLHLS